MNIFGIYPPRPITTRFSGNTGSDIRTSKLANTPISEAVFIFLDCEYTSLDPDQARLIEVSAIKVQGNRVIASYNTLVNPGVPIPPHISETTEITDEMVQTAGIPEREALQGLCRFMEADPTMENAPILAGDFPGVEIALLPRRLSAFGMDPMEDHFVLERAFCTRKLAEQSIRNGHHSFRFHQLPSSKNTDAYSIGTRLHIKGLCHETHRAESDTINARLVFYALVEMLAQQGIRTIGDLWKYQESAVALAT